MTSIADLAGVPRRPDNDAVVSSLDWVASRLGHFTPFDADDLYTPSQTKPFIELAIMLGVYVAATGDTTSQAIRDTGRLLRAVSDRAEYTDWALRFPAELVNYAELCAALDEFGCDTGELRHRLQRAVDTGAPWQVERLPHRLLELRAALDWAGVVHSLPSTGDLCSQTILGGAPSTTALPAASIYAITHVIFFSSRFGLTQDTVPSWLRSASVRSLLCDLLVVTSQARNWDLLGELLLCWDCLGFEHDLVSTAGWASFCEAFRDDGAVLPMPQTVQESEISDPAVDFDLMYHTTLVAVLAGTLRLYRSRGDAN